MATVVICTDASPHSQHAIQFYLTRVHRPGNQVKVIYVFEDWSRVGVLNGPTPGTTRRLQEEEQCKTDVIRDQCQGVMADHQVQGQFQAVPGSEPWEVICRTARQEGATLIVLGSRGQGKVRRTLLGSCSSSVVNHAHCPVLVCRHA
ncbi:hypothetical protein ACOMHN_049109 [Nucella lapillus]